MIDLNEIEEEIKALENGETSYENIQKLSWLYTVREHFNPFQKKGIAEDRP